MMAQRVQQDEVRLQSDVQKQQQMLKREGAATQILEKRAYPDGCVCECAASGCDEENHEGPVCHCPTDGKETSLPDQFAPWPFHQPGAARSGRSQGLPQQALYGNAPQMMQPHARPMARPARFQQKWVGSPQKFLPPDGDYPGGSTGIPLDGYLAYETGWANDGPFHGELAPMQEAGIADKAQPQALNYRPNMQQAHAMNSRVPMPPAAAATQRRARFQQKWVGSPQKFLPPDGDYPGGSTGIPLDGYLAYETGWANDGPFHGELAPMQEAGIADKAQRPQSLRAMPAPKQLMTARANRKMYASPANSQPKKASMLAARKSLLGDEMFGGDYDERVPAAAVDSDLFARSHTKSATLDAFDSLVR